MEDIALFQPFVDRNGRNSAENLTFGVLTCIVMSVWLYIRF